MRNVHKRAIFVCACLLAGAASVAGPQPAAWAQPAPKPQDVKTATTRFEKGSKLYEAKKYGLALEEFRASYAAVPSPNSHLYIARCILLSGDPKGAWVEFEKVVAEADARALLEPKYIPTRDTAKSERDELAGQLAFVTVTVQGAGPAAKVRVAGVEVPSAEWGKPLPVSPGPVDVVLENEGAPPVTRSLTLAAGDKKDVELAPGGPGAGSGGGAATPPVDPTTPDAPSDRSGLRPYAYIAGGVGVAGFALFTIAGIMASSTFSDLEDSCTGRCPPSRQDDIDSGKTQQTLANVGLVVGAVGIAAGATLFILSMGGGGGPKAATGSAAQSELLVGPGWVGARGRF